jgi:hypothetical protein
MNSFIKVLLIFSFIVFGNLIQPESLQAQLLKNSFNPFWLDETRNEENRLPMYASYTIYPTEKAMLKGDWESSENYLSLKGQLKLNLSKNENNYLFYSNHLCVD